MTGGVRGRLETGLSLGGERLQPSELPHAQGRGWRGGRLGQRWGRLGCDRRITCESFHSANSRGNLAQVTVRCRVRGQMYCNNSEISALPN